VSRYTTNNLLGIALMMLSMLLFEVMDAVAKWLVSADMSAIQVIAVRSWMILIMIPLILAVRGELGELRVDRPKQHLLRGMLGFLAPFTFFSSLKTLPLADATVVFFSAAFFLTAASALVLKERVGLHRWSAVVIGFAGVVIAMDPRADLLLPWVWVPVNAEMLGMLLLMAVIALIAHFIFTLAFARADVSVLAPFEYTALVWATIIGYVIWLDFPSPRVWTGAVIIIGCGLYVIHRESLHHKT
jgi:drug/metabolite transporter (DMT)-like permease